MRTPKHLVAHSATSARISMHRSIGAIVCGAVIGLAVVGVAAASPVPPTPPVITAPTPPTPPTPPVVVPPVPVSPNSVSNGSGESLDVSAQVTEIQQEVRELLTAGWGWPSGQLGNPSCDYQTPVQAFLAWGDDSLYMLAPDGDFSTTAPWALNAQATVVDGADPYSGAQQSLQLGAGGQAVSPAMCVNVNDPTIRFFVRDLNGTGSADVRVDVLYQGRNGNVQRLTLARVTAGSSWQPSPAVAILVNRLAATSPSGETAVSFVFTAEGVAQNESIGVSSLYVDPFQSV